MKLGIVAGSAIAIVTIFGLFHYADAAVDMFLKIPTIDGESTDEDHKDWINLLSINWGVENIPAGHAGGGGGAGKVSIQDMNFVKEADKSSPKLFLAVARGDNLGQAMVHITQSEGGKRTPFIIFNLDKAIVTSYSISGARGESVPTESFSLNFAKVEYTYDKQDKTGKSTGKVTTSWDIENNEVG